MTEQYICPFCEEAITVEASFFAGTIDYGDDAVITLLLVAECQCGNAVSNRNRHFNFNGFVNVFGACFESQTKDIEIILDDVMASSRSLIAQKLTLAISSQSDEEANLMKAFYDHKVEVKCVYDLIDKSKTPAPVKMPSAPDHYNCRCQSTFSMDFLEKLK